MLMIKNDVLFYVSSYNAAAVKETAWWLLCSTVTSLKRLSAEIHKRDKKIAVLLQPSLLCVFIAQGTVAS